MSLLRPAWRALCAVALTFASAAAMSAEPMAQLAPGDSQIGFVSKQMGVPVEGQFKKFDAQIAFDPKKPEGDLGIELPELAFDRHPHLLADEADLAVAWRELGQGLGTAAHGGGRSEGQRGRAQGAPRGAKKAHRACPWCEKGHMRSSRPSWSTK